MKFCNEEMGAFADSLVDHSTKSVEEYGALTTIDCVERRVEDCGADSEPECRACDVGEEGDGGLAAPHCCDLS